MWPPIPTVDGMTVGCQSVIGGPAEMMPAVQFKALPFLLVVRAEGGGHREYRTAEQAGVTSNLCGVPHSLVSQRTAAPQERWTESALMSCVASRKEDFFNPSEQMCKVINRASTRLPGGRGGALGDLRVARNGLATFTFVQIIN